MFTGLTSLLTTTSSISSPTVGYNTYNIKFIYSSINDRNTFSKVEVSYYLSHD